MKSSALFLLVLAGCVGSDAPKVDEPVDDPAGPAPRAHQDYATTPTNAVTTAAVSVPASPPPVAPPISASAPNARPAPPAIHLASPAPAIFAAATQQPQTVNAVQSGPWTVGVNTPVSLAPNTTVNATVSALPPVAISSLPSVAVSSLPAGLAIEPARQPFQAMIDIDPNQTEGHLGVDPGKRVVIQRIQASCYGAGSTSALAISMYVPTKAFYDSTQERMALLFFPLTKLAVWNGDRWFTNTETLLYLDDTTTWGYLMATTPATCSLLFSGYYVNVP